MRKRKCVIVLGLAAGLAGCGSSSSSSQTPAASTPPIKIQTTPTPGSTYHPKIVPADFTTHITNRFWPLKPGATWTYDGTKDHVPEHVVITVARDTKTILGVTCLVVHDRVTINGSLEENTTDWYAQDRAGSVWYFGEDSKDYKNGVVVSTQGTWEAGVDGAQPGVVITGIPKPGPTYRQEYRPGVAEDMARVLTTSSVQRVPAGTFRHVVETYDTDPLNPQKVERKFWAPGVGPVHVIRIGSFHQEEIKLISHSSP
jgi:hypothetical protein